MSTSLLYRQEILDHAQNPRNYGVVKHPHFQAEDTNVFCGDRIHISGRLDQRGAISGIRFEGEGCAISQAAASLLTDHLAGKSFRAAASMEPQDMLRLLSIALSPVRLKCGLLALTVVQKAYRQYTDRGKP